MNSWISLPELLLLPELDCMFFGCRPVCLTRYFVCLYGSGLRVHQSCKDKFPGSMLDIACSLSNCWNKRHARLPATAAQEFVSINDFVSNLFVLQSLVPKGLSVLTTSIKWQARCHWCQSDAYFVCASKHNFVFESPCYRCPPRKHAFRHITSL